MAKVQSEYEVEIKFIERLESIGYESLNLVITMMLYLISKRS